MSGPTGESSVTGQINPECPMTNDLKEFLRFNDGNVCCSHSGFLQTGQSAKVFGIFHFCATFPTALTSGNSKAESRLCLL